MQKFLTSTALALALAAPVATTAYAESQAHPMFGTATTEGTAHDVMASDLIGARLYTAENGVADDEMGQNKDWNDVGEIHDIVLNKDGEVDYVIADIGGFLGIGEKQVAVSMNELKFVSDGEDSDDWFIVLPASKAQLDEAPTYETAMDDTMRETGAAINDTAEATGNALNKAGEDVANAADNAATATGNAMQNAGEEISQAGDAMTKNADSMADETALTNGLTAEELTGKRVYDANGEWIGEVDKVLAAQDGTTAGKAVIDVGGFLGIGEKPVAVDLSNLMMKQEKDGDDMHLYVNATKQQLEDMPTYEES
ncbi:PRC-barrel domain-containing protein [Rhodalgimonas zhirmunskyi]|uniref:PRC-barrel domain-containing protein n=1 Tax=Rhodalgimonas zhirmunskyi TaxID=2964767 RepID=A0AAJ1UB71_9RHOB|nr:PRC-barrel domain-containing protein [Rhodoalgimonas zhirmunskyi]MDQ2095295.1 PRC-barrel domain-containing protein [Rhodoalgimonas zhirmunskyi]